MHIMGGWRGGRVEGREGVGEGGCRGGERGCTRLSNQGSEGRPKQRDIYFENSMQGGTTYCNNIPAGNH